MSELFGKTDDIYGSHLLQDDKCTSGQYKLHAVVELRKTIAFYSPHTHVIR